MGYRVIHVVEQQVEEAKYIHEADEKAVENLPDDANVSLEYAEEE
jgi:hypothetical protein